MSLVRCAKCNSETFVTPTDGGELVSICGKCKSRNHVRAFAALTASTVRDRPPLLPSAILAEGEASCFYSPGRRATAECGHCGVLISESWAAAWGPKTVCLKCLDHLRADTKNIDFQSRRTLWDNVVLAFAMVPFTLLFYWAVFITAPTAAFLGFWHWNSPRSIIPRGRWRLVIGLIIALIQIGLMVTGAGFLFMTLFE